MALFITTSEFKKYKAIDANTNFNTLLPFIESAEQDFIKPLLGSTLYDLLLSGYTSGGGTPADLDLLALLPYVQRPLALYAFYHGFTDLMASVGDAGIQVQRGNNTEPAPKWMHDKLSSKALRDADKHADNLLAFLEANKAITAYAGWANSPSNTIAQGMILHSASVASNHIDIQESRRIFLKMKRFIRAVEDKEIRKLICQDQYDLIVSHIKSASLTSQEETLLSYLRPIIAKEALWLLIPTLSITIDPEGLFMFSTVDPTVKKELASAEMVKNYRESLRTGITGFLADIENAKEFIINNIDDYPEIKDSSCYTSRSDPGPLHTVDNYQDRSHFSV